MIKGKNKFLYVSGTLLCMGESRLVSKQHLNLKFIARGVTLFFHKYYYIPLKFYRYSYFHNPQNKKYQLIIRI